LLPPLPPPVPVRGGQIMQPFAMRNSAANSSANLRMTPLFRRRSRMIRFCRESFALIRLSQNLFVLKQGGASKQKDNFIGLSGAAQMFAEGRQEMVKS